VQSALLDDKINGYSSADESSECADDIQSLLPGIHSSDSDDRDDTATHDDKWLGKGEVSRIFVTGYQNICHMETILYYL
jgi:hypothetical protein